MLLEPAGTPGCSLPACGSGSGEIWPQSCQELAEPTPDSCQLLPACCTSSNRCGKNVPQHYQRAGKRQAGVRADSGGFSGS